MGYHLSVIFQYPTYRFRSIDMRHTTISYHLAKYDPRRGWRLAVLVATARRRRRRRHGATAAETAAARTAVAAATAAPVSMSRRTRMRRKREVEEEERHRLRSPVRDEHKVSSGDGLRARHVGSRAGRRDAPRMGADGRSAREPTRRGGRIFAGLLGGGCGGPEDPPVVGMTRACSVRQGLGGAAAHLLSTAVSVAPSQVEDLGRHCWSEAVRASWPLPSCEDKARACEDKRDRMSAADVQLGHCRGRVAHSLPSTSRWNAQRRSSLESHGLARQRLSGLPCQKPVKPVWRHRIIYG
jgi:hypothetical protein